MKMTTPSRIEYFTASLLAKHGAMDSARVHRRTTAVHSVAVLEIQTVRGCVYEVLGLDNSSTTWLYSDAEMAAHTLICLAAHFLSQFGTPSEQLRLPQLQELLTSQYAAPLFQRRRLSLGLAALA